MCRRFGWSHIFCSIHSQTKRFDAVRLFSWNEETKPVILILLNLYLLNENFLRFLLTNNLFDGLILGKLDKDVVVSAVSILVWFDWVRIIDNFAVFSEIIDNIGLSEKFVKISSNHQRSSLFSVLQSWFGLNFSFFNRVFHFQQASVYEMLIECQGRTIGNAAEADESTSRVITSIKCYCNVAHYSEISKILQQSCFRCVHVQVGDKNSATASNRAFSCCCCCWFFFVLNFRIIYLRLNQSSFIQLKKTIRNSWVHVIMIAILTKRSFSSFFERNWHWRSLISSSILLKDLSKTLKSAMMGNWFKNRLSLVTWWQLNCSCSFDRFTEFALYKIDVRTLN